MKTADEYEGIFKNYELTELMTVTKKSPFKGLGFHLLLQGFLNDYGIYQSCKTWLGDANGENFNGQEVLAVSIRLGEFLPENELVLKQCYGWNDASVNIMLWSENGAAENFVYNLVDYSCTIDGKRFESLSEMLSTAKETKSEHIQIHHSITV